MKHLTIQTDRYIPDNQWEDYKATMNFMGQLVSFEQLETKGRVEFVEHKAGEKVITIFTLRNETS